MDKLNKRCSVISGERVRLRLVQRADIEMLRHWRNENRFAFIDSSHISTKQQKKWFERYQKKEDDLIFVIEKRDGKPIGTVSLYRIDLLIGRRAEFGRMIIGDVKSRKKGFAWEVSEILIRFAFSTLNLQQLKLEVLKNNHPAIKLYEKVGFRKVQAVENDHSSSRLIMILEKKDVA